MNFIGAQKGLNAALVKAVPLSETTRLRSPCVANVVLNLAMALDDATEGTISSSNHLKCASTTTRNIFPTNDPA